MNTVWVMVQESHITYKECTGTLRPAASFQDEYVMFATDTLKSALRRDDWGSEQVWCLTPTGVAPLTHVKHDTGLPPKNDIDKKRVEEKHLLCVEVLSESFFAIHYQLPSSGSAKSVKTTSPPQQLEHTMLTTI